MDLLGFRREGGLIVGEKMGIWTLILLWRGDCFGLDY